MWRSWKEGKCGRGKILLSPLSGRSISTCFHISLHSWHFGFGLWLTSVLPGFCEPSAWTQYIIGLLSPWNHFCQSSIIHFSFWLNFHKEPWLTQSLTLYVKLIWKSNFCLLWSILREFVSYALLTFQHWGDRSLSHPILGTIIFHISFIFFSPKDLLTFLGKCAKLPQFFSHSSEETLHLSIDFELCWALLSLGPPLRGSFQYYFSYLASHIEHVVSWRGWIACFPIFQVGTTMKCQPTVEYLTKSSESSNVTTSWFISFAKAWDPLLILPSCSWAE